MKTLQRIDQILSKIFQIMTYVGGVVICFIMILSVVNIITRSAFKAPIYGAIEVVSYGALLAGAFALAQNEMDDGNATMTLIVDKMKVRKKAVASVITNIICTIFYIFVSIRFYGEIGNSITSRQFTSILQISMSYFNAAMFVGFLLLAFATALKALRALCMLIGCFYNDEVRQLEHEHVIEGGEE